MKIRTRLFTVSEQEPCLINNRLIC